MTHWRPHRLITKSLRMTKHKEKKLTSLPASCDPSCFESLTLLTFFFLSRAKAFNISKRFTCPDVSKHSYNLRVVWRLTSFRTRNSQTKMDSGGWLTPTDLEEAYGMHVFLPVAWRPLHGRKMHDHFFFPWCSVWGRRSLRYETAWRLSLCCWAVCCVSLLYTLFIAR